jgi:hypothetical protein
MYKLATPIIPNTPSNSVIRLSDNANIPMVEANTDYQAYLKWVAEGNTPEAAQ